MMFIVNEQMHGFYRLAFDIYTSFINAATDIYSSGVY